ncbi:hypothetical protein [Moorena sp. SIO3A2]|uniref:hypothetical protein n=1 Tax=Moorena sp. SIO3A2 TaxID=2607841 RepID=UPI0013B7B962|nr:hypothetical protein [Moorena sp. SIO3A2]NER92227.1 hypothetical protein [Moorena sp. SIO3A2]
MSYIYHLDTHFLPLSSDSTFSITFETVHSITVFSHIGSVFLLEDIVDSIDSFKDTDKNFLQKLLENKGHYRTIDYKYLKTVKVEGSTDVTMSEAPSHCYTVIHQMTEKEVEEFYQ